ncbi:hypothetical protein KFV02_04245 [Desulfohalobiaceae bacterium Ax17]|uniref:hypothetical protein n=1 Tax=Desulfovulcanus ferrireducens TaxID=2831190 RepID=UPI00207B9EEE|nr:hypothetical protein [Desulfovulcanus ferrireducens]MBT8763137.1 hypothetical protein [Desulfovulcanus ferrireducens]
MKEQGVSFTMKDKKLRNSVLTIILLLCLATISTGCGKRVWPEPDVSEEKFALEIKEAKLINKCLRLKIYIKGNYANLSRITLELEPIGPQGECPACPFQVQQSVVFELDTPQIMRKGADLYIKYCQIQKNTDYRVRVKGRNVYPALPDVISNVVTVDE